jgi:hypothetical protein
MVCARWCRHWLADRAGVVTSPTSPDAMVTSSNELLINGKTPGNDLDVRAELRRWHSII